MSSPITIPAGEMSAIVQRAIVDSLSLESKNTMIAAALEMLMRKPEVDRYDRSKKGDSMLEQAFANALRDVANDVAKEVVAELRPEIALKIRPMVEAVSGEYDFDLATKLMTVMLEWAKEDLRNRSGY